MITKLYSARQRTHGQFAWGLFLVVLVLALALSGCGGGGGTGDVSDSGEVVIALTDAEGDFASYTVDVLSLTLTKANGAVVETLPLSTMELSSLQGTRMALVGIPEQPLPFVVDVTRINGRNASLYNFAGTGSDAASDADPFNYEVNTGVLDVAAIAGDAPLAVRGHVVPFGQAPLDFDAQTIVDRSGISP